MAGPAASVLLKKRLNESQLSSLQSNARAIHIEEHNCPFDLNYFRIYDTHAVGGNFRGSGRPFSISIGIQPDWDPEIFHNIGTEFGFKPEDEILISAFSNDEIDHRILAELCLHWAQQFDGIIDFGGALCPHPWPSSVDIMQADWKQVEPYFLQMIEGLPGRIVSVPYEPQPGRCWVEQVADTTFLQAWMNYEQFHMVK